MSKRGKVLRDPHMGPGLLIVEGKQYPFLLEGLWRSDVPAKPGLAVNVDFDPQGNVHGITAVPLVQLAQEQNDSAAAPDLNGALSHGWRLLSGIPAQIAAATLAMFSWCFLTAVSIHLPSFGSAELTFWQLLGYLNAGNLSPQISDVVANPDPGVLGLVAILVLAGPFLHLFWSNRQASLAGFLPLIFMIVAGSVMRDQLHKSLASQFIGGDAAVQLQVQHGIRNGISLGLGTFLSVSLGTYFATLAVTRFVTAAYRRKRRWERSQEFAA